MDRSIMPSVSRLLAALVLAGAGLAGAVASSGSTHVLAAGSPAGQRTAHAAAITSRQPAQQVVCHGLCVPPPPSGCTTECAPPPPCHGICAPPPCTNCGTFAVTAPLRQAARTSGHGAVLTVTRLLRALRLGMR